MSVWDRMPLLPAIDALRPSSLLSGLAAFGSFAPDASLQSVDLEPAPPASDLDALAGDWHRVGGDMRNAIGAADGERVGHDR
jgi:hypothetical protein